MKIHNPSVEAIKKRLHSTYKVEEIYTLIWALMRAATGQGFGLTPEKAHNFIDEVLGNHGIESIRFKYRGEVRTLYYSNTGDSYGQTVLRWDWTVNGVRRVVWFVGSWGDIAENPEYREVSEYAL